MLFDHRCAVRDGGDGRTNAHGMVREPYLTAKELAQMGDGADVAVLGCCGINPRTLRQDDVPATEFPQDACGPNGLNGDM
jgi:hypothetical protein